jgi:hypothetical protein
MESERTFTAFAENRIVASGDLKEVILRAKGCLDRGEGAPILIFEDRTGRPVDFDLRGTPEEALAKLASHPLFPPDAAPGTPRSGPGRPKLGVVGREVSLLPRHWDWLEQQPQGISAALRRLVEEARKRDPGKERARQLRDAAGKLMWTMAGNFPGFEEASRALFAGDPARFEELVRDWPEDIREYLCRRLRESARLEAMDPASFAS